MTKCTIFLNLALLHADSSTINLNTSESSQTLSNAKKQYTLETLLHMLKLKYISQSHDKGQDFLDTALNAIDLKLKLSRTNQASNIQFSTEIGADAITEILLSNNANAQIINGHFLELLDKNKKLVEITAIIATYQFMRENLSKAIAAVENTSHQNLSEIDKLQLAYKYLQLTNELQELEYKYETHVALLKAMLDIDVSEVDIESIRKTLLDGQYHEIDYTEANALTEEEAKLDAKAMKYNLYSHILSMFQIPGFKYKYYKMSESRTGTHEFTHPFSTPSLTIHFQKIPALRQSLKKYDKAAKTLIRNKLEINEERSDTLQEQKQLANKMQQLAILHKIDELALASVKKTHSKDLACQSVTNAELKTLESYRSLVNTCIKYYIVSYSSGFNA